MNQPFDMNSLLLQMQADQNELAGVDPNDNMSELNQLLNERDAMLDAGQHDQDRITESGNVLQEMLSQLDEAFGENAEIEVLFDPAEVEQFINEHHNPDNQGYDEDLEETITIDDDVPVHAARVTGTISFRPTNIQSPMTESAVYQAMEELQNVVAKLGCEIEFDGVSFASLGDDLLSKHIEL